MAENKRDVVSIVEQVIQSWHENGVELNPGASPNDLVDLSSLLGCAIPEDISEFYLLANGMSEYVYDNHQVSFWSIRKIRAERGPWGDGELVFADFLINSWRFIFSVDAGGVTVVSENVQRGRPLMRVGSFSEFLELYLRNASALGVL